MVERAGDNPGLIQPFVRPYQASNHLGDGPLGGTSNAWTLSQSGAANRPPGGPPLLKRHYPFAAGHQQKTKMGCLFALMAGLFPRLAPIGHWAAGTTQRNQIPGRCA